MPLFEYRCSACGRLEEVLQKHTDPAPDECPQCGAKNTMGKELSLSAFHLKGGGWYKDLYASSPASSSSSSSSDTSSTSTPKTETKSEAKTETKAAAPAAPAASSSSSSSSSAA